jgi:RNA polymerase II subunit A-like phosphatase
MDRALINITHDSKGVSISMDEAVRIEEENTKRLLNLKKMSLLLDLDQTLVHAAIDFSNNMSSEELEKMVFP